MSFYFNISDDDFGHAVPVPLPMANVVVQDCMKKSED